MEFKACDVKETNGSYSAPFLRTDRISDHVEDGDTVYMVYDLQDTYIMRPLYRPIPHHE